jgi:uncharacterized protein YccT (UPF0319 family)
MKILQAIFVAMTSLLWACSVSSVQPSNDLPTLGQGDVEVIVPSTLRVLAINGQNVDSPNLYTGQYRLLLTEGSQRIVVQYEENWNSPEESGFLIRWQPVAIDSDFRANQRYVLTHAPVRDRDQAEELQNSSPIWLIGDNHKITGQPVVKQKDNVTYVAVDSIQDSATRLEQLQDIWAASSDNDKAAFQQWLQQQQ